MRAILKDGLLIITTESEADLESFAAWRTAAKGHVFYFAGDSAKGGAFRDLGPREDACRENLNIVYGQCETRWQPISNLAFSPFVLRGTPYNSVEGFWQGLRFDADEDRTRVAAFWGREAKQAAAGEPQPASLVYEGETYPYGGHRHRGLMLEACRAKFAQNEAARMALLATGERMLVHRTRRDSLTVPGVLMADMWMRIRAALRDGTVGEDELAAPAAESEPTDGRIFFFSRDRARYGFLSHFCPSPIEIDGEFWPTVEHYYQAQKSLDPAYRAAIRACQTPGNAKQLASTPDPRKAANEFSWFTKTGLSPRPDWADVKLDIMRRADMAKYTQNPDLAARLLATCEREIVEDSPFDAFWGTGPDGSGLNWAGHIIMEVRARLRRHLTGPAEKETPIAGD